MDREAEREHLLGQGWLGVDARLADVAFHRTLLGLRAVLRPDRRGSRRDGVITFHNDRYRLDPSVVAWSDVDEFERLLTASADPEDGLRALELARTLYRGDYLDDCPYYGDSADVEERRQALRARYVDLLVELSERYAARGDRTAAAACFRDAQAAAGDELAGRDHLPNPLVGPQTVGPA